MDTMQMTETFARTRKAAALFGALDTDPRTATEADWAHAVAEAGVRTPSAATRAAVVALADVTRGDFRNTVSGSGDERIAYNVMRKAALIAAAFDQVGADGEPSFHQWSLAAQIANVHTGVKDGSLASETVREAVRALRSRV